MSDLYLDGFKCSASQMLVLDMVTRTLREIYQLKPFRLPGLSFEEVQGGSEPVNEDEPYGYCYFMQRFMATGNISFGLPRQKCPIAVCYERTYAEHLPSNDPGAYFHQIYVIILTSERKWFHSTRLEEATDTLKRMRVNTNNIPFELRHWAETKLAQQAELHDN